MEPKGKKPSGRGCNRAWLHVKVVPGMKFEAWVAGPHVCVESHHIHSTKPCLKAYLGATVECPGCSHPSRIEDQLLLPLYRCLDGRPVCVWFHDDMADALAMTKLHEHVVIGKTTEPKTGAYLQRLLGSTNKYQTTLAERKVTADISEYMPVLFGMVGVISPQQLRDGPIVSDAPAVPKASPETARTKELQAKARREREELEKVVRKRLKGAAENVIIAELENEWVRFTYGIGTGSNGTH